VTLLNRELVSRAKLCLVSVFPDIVKDCPKIRNLPKIFLRSFENVAPDLHVRLGRRNLWIFGEILTKCKPVLKTS